MAKDRHGNEFAVGDIVIVQAEVLRDDADGKVVLEAIPRVEGQNPVRFHIPATNCENETQLLDAQRRDMESRLERLAADYEARIAALQEKLAEASAPPVLAVAQSAADPAAPTEEHAAPAS